MKRIYAYILFIMCVCYTCAQTQQGIVKTRGRMVNGQLVAGQRISGATITLNFGNALVSGSQGGFSFNVPTGKTYSLVMAKKLGYTLADPEYTRRSFKYSASNPFYVVLEDETQRQADINAATKKVRRTLTAQLQKREDEIEAMKKQNKITEQEYQKKLQELYDSQSKSEQLVKEMAERYASTDYDQLDEFNRKVQMYIEEGELQKADSMIRSKGNIDERVTEYFDIVAANKKERENLNLRDKALKQSEKRLQISETLAAKIYKDLIQDLNRYHEILIQEHKPDSALMYLKMLADLDITNVVVIYDYANSAYKRLLYDEALKYAQIALKNAKDQNNTRMVALAENLLGNIYMALNRLSESKEMYLQCLVHIDNLLTKYDGTYYRHIRTMPTVNLATIYQRQGDIQKAEEYYLKSLIEHKELIRLNYKAYIWDYVWTEDRLGLFYIDIRNYEEAKKHLDIALSTISDSITFPSSIEGNTNLYATVRDHLGWLNFKIGDYSASIVNYIYALKYFEYAYTNDPNIYRDNLARIYFYVMMSYAYLKDVTNYDRYLEKAIELYNQLHELHIDGYKNDLIELRNRKVWRMLAKSDIDDAIEYAKITCSLDASNENAQYCLALCYNDKSLSQAKILDFTSAYTFIDNAISMFSDNANFYDTKGEILLMQGKKEEALEMWKKVIELNPNFLEDYPDGTNLSNGLRKLGLIE